jgi:RimJ/RimL family protein N-acetyltransferase
MSLPVPDPWLQPPALAGRHVRLQPLARAHHGALALAVQDGALWQPFYSNVPQPDAVGAYLDTALAEQAAGRALPFVVRDAHGVIVGSTRYYDLAPGVPRLSIGYTWYAQRVQRSGLNTEAKLLLLEYAFGTLGCIAVELRTSWFNHASRAAIARLGAKQDGVLRAHMRHRDGSVRDSVVFSILDNEWPALRAHLRERLDRHASAEKPS